MPAPRGNRNAANGTEWRDAIRRTLREYENPAQKVERGEALSRIAYKIIESAIDGDQQAIKEIGERLDGKAKQLIDANINFLDRLTEAEQSALLAAIDATLGPSDRAETGTPAED